MAPIAGATTMKPDRCAINVKPPLLRHRWHSRLITLSWETAELRELKCIGSGHARPHCVTWRNRTIRIADILIERHIDEYLKADPFSLAHALERLRRAIHYEELKSREGEDWSIAKNYVRLLLSRMT